MAEINNWFDEDLQLIMGESRILSINARHGIINLEHFLVAMLRVDCKAATFLSELDREHYYYWLSGLFAQDTNVEANDSIPLTVHAERIVRHALHLASYEKNVFVNSVHLLLAMLSYKNTVSDQVKLAGIIFEDISADYSKGSIPKEPLEIKLRTFYKGVRIGRSFRILFFRKKLLADIVSHARTLYTYQQYNDCIATCRTGLVIESGNDVLRDLLAYSFLYTKAYGDAIKQFQELLIKKDNSVEYRFSMGYCYMQLQDYKMADNIWDALLIEDPYHELVLNNKGFSLQQQERYEEAAPFYERAIAQKPSFAYPYNNLGFVKYKLGNEEEALPLVDKALELDKGNSFAYKYKGIIYYEKGDKEQALDQFLLALKYGYTKQHGNEVLEWVEKCRDASGNVSVSG